jgi:hypothetical protein
MNQHQELANLAAGSPGGPRRAPGSVGPAPGRDLHAALGLFLAVCVSLPFWVGLAWLVIWLFG